MTIYIDPITRKKLIIVKQLYQNAIVQSTAHQVLINRLLAVIGFDLAVETLLRTIVTAFDPSKSLSDGFQGLMHQSETALASAGYSPLPDKANIQHVHSIRNDGQHKAKYPNESDISDCRTYVRDFLQKVVVELWGLDFEKITLTDVIQNEEIRQFFIDAETSHIEGNYQKAVQSASVGLTIALNKVEAAIVGEMPSFASGIMLLNSFGDAMSESNCRDAYRAIERIQDTLLYLALGMNYAHFMEYRKITGHVFFTMDGKSHFNGQMENIEQNDAEFVLSYTTNVVVQIESIVGSIDAPFGTENWY
jgi:hypothetical protein